MVPVLLWVLPRVGVTKGLSFFQEGPGGDEGRRRREKKVTWEAGGAGLDGPGPHPCAPSRLALVGLGWICPGLGACVMVLLPGTGSILVAFLDSHKTYIPT